MKFESRYCLMSNPPMTPNQFRKIALAFDGAVEASHMNHPDFRADNGKIFATLNEDETRGMASLTPEQQAELIERAPEAFVPAAGAWGRNGSTMIVLAKANQEIVGEALTLAWQSASAKAPARRAAKASAATRQSAKAKTARLTPARSKNRARKRP